MRRKGILSCLIGVLIVSNVVASGLPMIPSNTDESRSTNMTMCAETGCAQAEGGSRAWNVIDVRTERWGANSTAEYASNPMDAMVRSDYPTYNYGTVTAMAVDDAKYALMYFDTPELTPTDTITRAVIRIWTQKRYRSGYHLGSLFEVYGIRDQGQGLWMESEVTFNQSSSGMSWDGTSGNLLTALDDTSSGVEWYTTRGTNQTDYPHWQDIDITELVRDWVNGVRPNYGVAMKMLQHYGINPEFNTKEYSDNNLLPYLEVTYHREGQGNPARPEQPANVQAFHRQGQTFITFDEVATTEPLDLAHMYAIRYRVYRHTQPINATNIEEATQIADLSRGSSKIHYALAFTKFTEAFGTTHVITDYGTPLNEDTGLFVYTVKPGDMGGQYYYAVTTVAEDNENLIDFTTSNTIGPLSESHSAVKRPVILGDSPDGNNTQYMMWMDYDEWGLYGQASPMTETLFGESYAFGFRVGKPGDGAAGPYPLVMRLNAWGAHGIALTNTGPEKYGGDEAWIGLTDTYAVWHDDNYKQWHFGHINNLWTGEPPLAEYGAKVVNYRQAFYIEILKWMLDDNFAGYNVDEKQMYLTGGSMGGTGTFSFAVQHPEYWAAVMAQEGITDWLTVGTVDSDSVKWHDDVIDDWGPITSNLPVYDLINHSNTGYGIWDYQSHGARMLDNRGSEVTLITANHGTLDNVIEWQSQGYPWYLDNASYALAAQPMFGNWGTYGHAPDRKPYKTAMFFGRVDEPLLAFTHSVNNDVSPADFGIDSPGQINKGLEWSNSANTWDGLMQETFTTFDCSIRINPSGVVYGSVPTSDSVNVTPRRLQTFVVMPTWLYQYTVTSIDTLEEIASGIVIADSDGLLTIPDVPVDQPGVRLHIEAIGGQAYFIYLPAVLRTQ